MSGGRYRRATKKHAVRVEYTDGSASDGFVPVPLGMDFVGVLMQAQGFLQFETEDGEETFLNLSAIKRITSTQPEEEAQDEYHSTADKAKSEREAEAARKRESEQAAQEEASQQAARGSGRAGWTGEEYDALEILGLKSDTTRSEIQMAYRKLVKLYHPDRLRGLGVSPKKIEFAAQRLSEINSAYRVLMSSDAAAA